jgi:hypothetical protein
MLSELIPADKSRRAEIRAEAKKSGILMLHVNDGNCKHCPVKSKCEYAEKDTEDCKLMLVACNQIVNEASLSPSIRETDSLAVRNAASLYAGIVFSERFFAVYGITRVKNGEEVVYTDMYKEYTKLITKFDELVGNIGLSPYGRKKLQRDNVEVHSKESALERYIDALDAKEASKEKEGTKGQDKHNRVLQGSEPSEPTSTGYSGGNFKSGLRARNDKRPKKPAKKNNRRPKSKVNSGV